MYSVLAMLGERLFYILPSQFFLLHLKNKRCTKYLTWTSYHTLTSHLHITPTHHTLTSHPHITPSHHTLTSHPHITPSHHTHITPSHHTLTSHHPHITPSHHTFIRPYISTHIAFAHIHMHKSTHMYLCKHLRVYTHTTHTHTTHTLTTHTYAPQTQQNISVPQRTVRLTIMCQRSR